MLRKPHFYQLNQGLTLIELMTVLIIIMLLAMVGFPTYQEYQNRANLAEAQTTMGTMEKNLRTYFLDHGSFYSAAPTPATVPGLASLGDSSAFTTSGGWAAIGSPVANGAAVNFSYQAYAGQTPNGSTTPVVNEYLNDPTTNMNLIRRTSTAYNYHFPQSAGIASGEEKLRLDWSDFGFCANAADGDFEKCEQKCKSGSFKDAGACINDCKEGKSGTCASECADQGNNPDDCNKRCSEPGDGTCSGVGDADCYPSDSKGKTALENCSSACSAAHPGKESECAKECEGSKSDGACDGEITDIDCYHDDSKESTRKTAAENCTAACDERSPGSHDKCAGYCNEPGDGKCEGNNLDVDCYKADDDEKTASQSCVDTCTDKDEEKRPLCQKQCQREGDGKCDIGDVADIDCYDGKESKPCVAAATAEDEDKDPCSSGGGNGGLSGGGSGGGGDAGGGSDNGGDDGSGDISGEAGGGSGSGDGSESGNEGATSSQSSAECASFGISKPTDLGIQTNVQGYNWVAMTAVGNFSPGSECTLVAKLIQVVGGQMTQTDFIKVNVGE